MGRVRETEEILALQIHSLGASDRRKALCHPCPSQGCGLNDNDPLPRETSAAEKGIKLQGIDYQPAAKAMYLMSFINLKAEIEKKGGRASQGLLC